MKKILLLICLIIPLAGFSQEKLSQRERFYQEKEQRRLDLINKTPGDHLQSASKNLIIGTTLSVTGGAVAGMSAFLVDDYDTQKTVAIVGGVTSLVGIIFSVRGFIEIGKAGKKLNYEVKGTEAKLAFSF